MKVVPMKSYSLGVGIKGATTLGSQQQPVAVGAEAGWKPGAGKPKPAAKPMPVAQPGPKPFKGGTTIKGGVTLNAPVGKKESALAQYNGR